MPLEKYVFLQQLKDTDQEVFYQLTMRNMTVRTGFGGGPCVSMSDE